MSNRIALLLRAGMAEVIEKLGLHKDTRTSSVATALENVSWVDLASLTDEELGGSAGHDFDASADGQSCYICGANRDE